MKFALFLALSLVFGAAAAQTQKPPAPEERPAAPAPRLNLKLDDASRYAREAPRGSADALPTLGGDARTLPAAEMPTSTRPFPQDSERRDR